MTGRSPWPGRVARAFSIRLILGTFLLSLVAGVGLGMVWEPLMNAFFLLWPLTYLAGVFNDEQALNCGWCGKMVKLGSSACHHCGREQEAA